MATFHFYNIVVAVSIYIGIAWLWRFVHAGHILGREEPLGRQERKPMGLYHNHKFKGGSFG